MQYEVIASFIICYIASPDTITVISMLALMPVVCPTAGPGIYQLWELAICWVLEGHYCDYDQSKAGLPGWAMALPNIYDK